jgi:glycosyltransferase involved in cell wall biosynthesis
MLQGLLESLARQTILHDPAVELGVAVFDNDPAGSAQSVVHDFKDLPVEYILVPEPGLAAVRNQSLHFGKHAADFLAFIDDDEEATPDWLRAFLDARRKTGANILCGSRTPRFQPGSESWLVEEGFFQEPGAPDLGEISYGHTANTFIACDLLKRHPISFDPALSFTGGEDVMFFARLQALGEKILYVRSARAIDWIPPERISAAFLLKRSFRSGGTLFCVERATRGLPRAIVVRGLRAAFHAAHGAAILLRSPARKAAWLRCGLKLGLAAGSVSAMFGLQVQPYAYGRKRPAG